MSINLNKVPQYLKKLLEILCIIVRWYILCEKPQSECMCFADVKKSQKINIK